MRKTLSKLLLFAAVIIAVICLSPAKAQAADFAGGKGTKSSPYLVKTYDQLLKLSYNKYQGCYFKQTRDIDCKGKKIPTLFGSTFSGSYDGNNKKIMNITVETQGDSYIAGNVAAKGVIKNLTFYKPTVRGKYVATIFKNNYGILKNVKVVSGKFSTKLEHVNTYSEAAGLMLTNRKTGVVEKCSVSNSKIVSYVDAWTGTAQVAGIACNNEGTIKDSKVVGVTFSCLSIEYTAKIGGICAWNNKGTVSGCKVEVKSAIARGDKHGRYGAVEYGEIGKIVHYNEGTVKKCTVSKSGKWSADKTPKVIYTNKGKYIK